MCEILSDRNNNRRKYTIRGCSNSLSHAVCYRIGNMATPQQIPKASLAKLKCSWCNLYLSVPPITMAKDKFTCGRCNPGGKRVTIYEELLKVVKFPCVYANCNVLLSWQNVKNHEEQCAHKTIPCPHYNCKQQFVVRTIEKHFINSHLEFIQPNPTLFTKGIGNEALYKNFKSDKKVLLMKYKEKAYLAFVLSNCTPDINCKDLIQSYSYKFGVCSVDSQKNNNIKYSVSLKSLSGQYTFTYLKEKCVQPFKENVHCFRCLLGSCPVKYHKKTDWLQMEFQNIAKLPDMKIEFEIKIYEDQPKVVQEVKQLPVEIPIISDMAKKLQCPICNEYMCTPIYNCAKGHTICSSCKELLSACPFCKATIGNSRNYILEDIADTLKIPCVNSKKGCLFVGLVRNVTIHKTDCLFNNE